MASQINNFISDLEETALTIQYDERPEGAVFCYGLTLAGLGLITLPYIIVAGIARLTADSQRPR